MTSQRASQAACARITRRASSNFTLATYLFDRETRQAIQALYAFCRVADDIADSTTLTSSMKRRQLMMMRRALHIRKSPPVETDIWPAVFNLIKVYRIPIAELETVLDGVTSDIVFRQPLTISELDRYSYEVAGIVGILCARILGATKRSTLLGAKQLGIGMQYVNIIRDVGTDIDLQRIYIPQSVLREAQLTPAQLLQRTNQAGLERALTILTKRAQTYLTHAARAIDDLHPSYQRPVRYILRLYAELLERIKQKQYTVYSQRVSIPTYEKLLFLWHNR